jgi:rod shape determining protein RodA
MSVLLGSRRPWDIRLAGSAAVIAIAGLIAMASAASTLNPALAVRHGVYVIVGGLVFAIAARTNYHRWTDLAPVVYGISGLALLAVFAVGTVRLGATRWLSLFGVSLQPSEFAKFALVLLLARYLSGQPRPLSGRAVMVSAALAGLPALLIFQQPDLGSATILGAIWLGMVWVAGLSRRWLLILSGGFLALLPLAWSLLKSYQRDRLLAFIDPHADPLGVGYTIIQSTIAIGSGRLWGRGWFAGTQNQLNFLPERHSDFIFSVIGEEWGLLGCTAVVAAFALLLSGLVRIALETSEPHGRLLLTGIGSWIGYQAFVNMGMVMGLLPVVGVPLPLVSFGGSSMVTLWLALGLAQSVRRAGPP